MEFLQQLAPDPFQQFERWYGPDKSPSQKNLIEKVRHGVSELAQKAVSTVIPSLDRLGNDAMVLSTVDSQGRPRSRVVLLRGFSSQGFCFYSNYDSEKGQDLKQNPQACLLFTWSVPLRQLRIDGRVEKMPHSESQGYWQGRPYESQLASAVSKQSRPLESREKLLAQIEDKRARLQGRPVPLPQNWGGYVLQPDRFEFWEGGAHRIHNRAEYFRSESGRWDRRLLYP